MTDREGGEGYIHTNFLYLPSKNSVILALMCGGPHMVLGVLRRL